MPGGGEDLQTNARCWEVQTGCEGTEGAHSEEEISQAVTETPIQEGIGKIALP